MIECIDSILLYYHHNSDGLTVTNSLTLLESQQFELKPQGIFNYCYFHCIPAPTTIHRDVYKKSLSDFLAPESLSKSKHGFGLPFGTWVKQSDELMAVAETAQSSQ